MTPQERLAAVKAELQKRIAVCDAVEPRAYFMRIVTQMGEDAGWCPRYEIINGHATGRNGWIRSYEQGWDARFTANSRNNRPAELACLVALAGYLGKTIMPHAHPSYGAAILAILESHLGLSPEEK